MPLYNPQGYSNWTNLTASRALATAYTLTRPTLIMVSVNGASGSGSANAEVNGVALNSVVYASVTTGYAYTVTFAGKAGDVVKFYGATLTHWFEAYI